MTADITKRPMVLSIGTTEPWASAGIALDLYMADRLDIRLSSVIVGVSAQDGKGLFSCASLDAAVVRSQFEALVDLRPAAIRIGALSDPSHVHEIARYLEHHNAVVVFDPVFATSAGGIFADGRTREAMIEQLFPRVTLLTPNLDEAARLAGFPVTTLGEMDAAALVIADLGAKAVIIKGGHLQDQAVDVLWDGRELRHLEAPRLPGTMRGTGCVFALTAAAAFAYGHALPEAVRVARDVVRILLTAARTVGSMRIVP